MKIVTFIYVYVYPISDTVPKPVFCHSYMCIAQPFPTFTYLALNFLFGNTKSQRDKTMTSFYTLVFLISTFIDIFGVVSRPKIRKSSTKNLQDFLPSLCIFRFL